MSHHTVYTTRGRALLWAVVMGVAAAVGYLVAELIAGHDLTFVPYGMVGIFVVLTAFSYFLNIRNVRKRP